MQKKDYRMFLMVVLAVALLVVSVPYRAQSESMVNMADVSFSAGNNIYSFFDPAKHSVYIYSPMDGKLQQKWEIKELGKDMVLAYQFNEKEMRNNW